MRAVPNLGALGTYILRLRRAIEEFGPTVVHTHGMKMHWLGALSTPPGIPLVWHMHDLLGQRRIMARALRVVASRVDRVLANSRSVAADAARVLGTRCVEVVYNGIDTETFSPTGPAADLDAISGCAPAAPGTQRVGLVATYAKWKGHDVFLRAAKLVVDTFPAPVRFYIVGGQQYMSGGSQFSESELREMAQRLGLGGHVAFVPFQHQPERVFRALDVVVHASTLPEPFGRTIVEGMACGRAVIAVNEGGAAELIQSGVNAWGVPPRDPAAIADACRRLASDPEMRLRFGVAGRETAVERFSRDRMGRQILKEYELLAAT
jgi:glycosyltransferase involved in cell wall biosynthesis